MRSVINKNVELVEDIAVVALLRKPKGKFPEHAFIVVERINRDEKDNIQVNFTRYDFHTDQTGKNGEVALPFVKSVEPSIARSVYDINIIRCKEGENVVGKSWLISGYEADLLNQEVLKSMLDYKLGKPYNVLGDDATYPETGDATRATCEQIESVSGCKSALFSKNIPISPAGHSCITWARAMLCSIGNAEINKTLPRSPLDLVATITSHHLPEYK